MSEQQSFTPPDPEFETTEFLQDVAADRFIYQTWLERVATQQELESEDYRARFYSIPQFFYNIPGIAKDISIDLKCKTSALSDDYSFDSITLRSEDYGHPVSVKNDHGIFIIQHGDSIALAPPDAHQIIIHSLFSERDRSKPQKELVDYLANNSFKSIRQDVFETIGENDNSVRIAMITTETDGDSSIALEVSTKENHPSSALVGTRLTMYDSLESALASDSSLSIMPDTSVSIDVKQQHARFDDTEVLLAPLINRKRADRSIPIPIPKRYHEGHIIEALYALEQAAKAA